MSKMPIAGEAAMKELAETIGVEAARKLARQFGGTSIYVPRTIGDHHPICAVIGRNAADLLSSWAGGSAISVPKQAERRERVRTLRRETALTICQIARETSYSERHVFRLLSEEEDARQPRLFE